MLKIPEHSGEMDKQYLANLQKNVVVLNFNLNIIIIYNQLKIIKILNKLDLGFI